mmetsp:Transcript_38930/g.117080  ORF Transcript_38930/g.117080 Transcript_38930/m.117080 type:complete len:487 (-) Transcript_38930:192-1652(-)
MDLGLPLLRFGSRHGPGGGECTSNPFSALGVPQFLHQFKAEGPSGPLVSVHGRTHKGDAISPGHETLHHRQGYRRRLVDRDNFRGRELVRLVRTIIPNRLPMIPMNLDPHHAFRGIPPGVGIVLDRVIQMLLILERLESPQTKIEHRDQILRLGSGHDDVGISERDGAREAQPDRRRFASTASCRQGDGRFRGTFRARLQKRQYRPGLIERPCQFGDGPDVGSIAEGFLQRVQFIVLGGSAGQYLSPVALMNAAARPGISQFSQCRFGQRQHVQFVVAHEAIGTLPQTQNEPLVKSRHHIPGRFGSIPRMHVHAHRVQLPQTLHGPHQKHNQSSPLDGFDGPGHEIGSQRLEILKDEHSDRRTQYPMRIAVVAPFDVGRRHKQFEIVGRLILGRARCPLGESPGLIAFDLLHALLPMSRKAQFLLVAPQNLRPSADRRSTQNVMQIRYLILPVISDQYQHRSLSGGDSPLEEGTDALVELLSDHDG